MLDYNFQTLSPIEFETLSRDLLQAHLNITLQSFAAGRDGGIDLRYSTAVENPENFIVQCKRHISTYAKLKRHLENEELPKVKRLNPDRYLLITSVDLTDKNKQELLKVFKPFVISTSDIYSRSDVNNLLGLYPNIERQYYKLWLSSTTILETILHSDIVNKTSFERDEILNSLETYVENDSLTESIEVFKKKQLLLIAGEAGVGKTTLAQMLIYNFLAKKKYEEFIYISRGVEEALRLYKQDIKQLFFFDDFLGRVAFDSSFERNEESDLARFVEKIAKNKNKGLILTTREYILNQARSQYEEINSPLFRNNEYLIDLGKYTRKVKAQVLYNHLSAKKLPHKYVQSFLKDKTYLEIIDHQNYNPRLISTILDEEPWRTSTPSKFPFLFISFINDPFKLWKSIFERGISNDARALMKILLTIHTPVDTDKLFIAFNSYANQDKRPANYHNFESILRELENTFINIKLPIRYPPTNTQSVDFKNPSILDFLVSYYGADNQIDLLSVIKSAVYVDQLTSRFISDTNPQKGTGRGLIILNKAMTRAIKEKVLSGADKLSPSRDQSAITYSWSSSGHNDTYSKILDNFLYKLELKEDIEVFNYLKDQFNSYNAGEINNTDMNDHYYLLELFREHLTSDEIVRAIAKLAESVKTLSDLEGFYHLANTYPFEEIATEWLEENSLREQATDAILAELNEVSDDKLIEYRQDLNDLESTYDFDTDVIYQRYEELVEESRHSLVDDVDLNDTKIPQREVSKPVMSEQDEIIDMFSSLN
jgi:energy-coupling factor transporter ATP-binding protein EcfA2